MASKPIALIVEDDETIAFTVQELLREEGYDAVLAPGLSEARATLATRPPKVVYLDLMLGEEWGGDLLRDFARENGPNVVIVSASLEGQALADAWSIECVRKPFDIEALLAALVHARRPVAP